MKTVKFSDVVTRANTKEDRFNTDKIYYVGGEHIDSNEMKIEKRGIIAGSTIGPMFYCGFKSGDILFVTRNPHLRKCGVVDFDGICSEKTFVLETKNRDILLQEYLAIVMQSDDFWNYCEENKSGGVNYFLNWSTLAEYEFPLPSLAVQKVLAEKLWAAYEVKQSYLKMIEATQEMVKSQFIEMFGGGNWPQKTLGEVGSFTRGGGFQKSDFVEHGIPCIHYGQIHTKFGPFITSHITEISSDLESKTKFASKGDLVIAITSEDTEGSCKSTAWLGDYSVAVGGHAAIYKHSMNPLYISFFFKSTLFNHAKIEYVHGTKVFEIKPDDIAKILVPCPPMSLQNQFSAIAEQADKSEFELRESIDAIDKVIKSLINENL